MTLRLTCLPALLLLLFTPVKGQFLMDFHTQDGMGTHSVDGRGNVYLGLTVSLESLGGKWGTAIGLYRLGIAKFDSTGMLKWTVQSPESPTYPSCSSLEAAPDGDVFFEGRIEDSLRWAGQLHLSADPQFEPMVGKIDAGGQAQWLHTFSPMPWKRISGIRPLRAGGVVVVGELQGPGSFNGFSIPATTVNQGYVMVLDDGGQVQKLWMLDAPGDSKIIAVDEAADGDLILAGQFRGATATWQGTTVQGISGQVSCSFFSRVNIGGGVEWNRAFTTGQYTAITDVDVDGNDNAYFGGQFRYGITLDTVSLAQSGVGTRLLAGKLSATGHALWLRATDTGPIGEGYISRVDANAAGEVLVSGQMPLMPVNFAGQPLNTMPYNQLGFAILFEPSGTPRWAVQPPINSIGGGGWASWQDANTVMYFDAYNSGLPRPWDGYWTPNTESYYYGQNFGRSTFTYWARICADCNLLIGTYYADLNQDGSYGAGDAPIPNNLVRTGGQMAMTDAGGRFRLLLPQGQSLLDAAAPSAQYASITGVLSPLFNGTGNVDSSFTLANVPQHWQPEDDIYLLTTHHAITNKEWLQNIVYHNLGSLGDSLVVRMTFDSALVPWYVSPPADLTTDSSYEWHVANVAPLSSGNINVGWDTLWPWQLGDSLRFTVTLQSLGGDTSTWGQTDAQTVVVTDSAWHEELTVFPTETTPQYLSAGGWVTYCFQSDGYGPPRILRSLLTDTMNSGLDPTTLQLQTSMPDLRYQYYGDGRFQFRRDAYAIPDPGYAFDYYQDYILFRLQAHAGPFLQPEITHHACVQYGFEMPLCGPATVVPVPQPLGEAELEDPDGAVVFPNPARGSFNVRVTDGPLHDLQLYDLHGRVVATAAAHGTEGHIDATGLPSGVYLLRFGDAHHRAWEKVVLMR